MPNVFVAEQAFRYSECMLQSKRVHVAISLKSRLVWLCCKTVAGTKPCDRSVARMAERGGYQQRRKRKELSGASGESRPRRRGEEDVSLSALWRSPLGEGLVMRWGEASLPATDVQNIAHQAVLSGCPDPVVVSLSQLGASGTQAGNINRDLTTKFCKNISLPQPTMVDVPMLDPSTNRVIQVRTAIYLPHQWMSSLSRCYEEAFASLFGLDHLQRWWASQDRRNPKFHDHPCLHLPIDKCIPVVLHGDGCEFSDRDSLNVLSLKPVLFKKTGAKDQHFVLAAVPKSCTTGGTWQAIWRWIVWSLEALVRGVHPDRDPEGRPCREAGAPIIKGGMYAFVWGFCADLEYFSSELKLPHHSANRFCWRCRCDRSDEHAWTDFSVQAPWRETTLTAQELVDTEMAHPFFDRKIGTSLATIMLDSMHTLDLGVSLYCMGSVLFTIIFDDMESPDKVACCAEVWCRLQEPLSDWSAERQITMLNSARAIAEKRYHC